MELDVKTVNNYIIDQSIEGVQLEMIIMREATAGSASIVIMTTRQDGRQQDVLLMVTRASFSEEVDFLEKLVN